MESFLVQYGEELSSVTEEVRSFESSESGLSAKNYLEGELTNNMQKSKDSLTPRQVMLLMPSLAA
jgi:hypothetical protein